MKLQAGNISFLHFLVLFVVVFSLNIPVMSHARSRDFESIYNAGTRSAETGKTSSLSEDWKRAEAAAGFFGPVYNAGGGIEEGGKLLGKVSKQSAKKFIRGGNLTGWKAKVKGSKINEAARNLTKKARAAGAALEKAGKAGDALDKAGNLAEAAGSLYEGDYVGVAQTGANAGLSGASASGGAWAGGKLGATVGTYVGGPYGTVVGGAIGTIVGAITGSVAYDAYGKPTVNRAADAASREIQDRQEKREKRIRRIRADLAALGWGDSIDPSTVSENAARELHEKAERERARKKRGETPSPPAMGPQKTDAGETAAAVSSDDKCLTDPFKTEPGICGCNNPEIDYDGDGICDTFDLCQGNNATGDEDGDRICGDRDKCKGNDKTGDKDGDKICNDLDVCRGNDVTGDTDNDGVCDDQDKCRGVDETGDKDGDKVCNDLDECRGDDASGDTDGDKICNNLDKCDGHNDSLDSDRDTVPDGCDRCRGDDTTGDRDNDKVCDSDDACPGLNDLLDADKNGFADCKEAKKTCPDNQDLVNGNCVPKCGSSESRDASGNCVYDPRSDIGQKGGKTCPNNKDTECPDNYRCVNYQCIPEDTYTGGTKLVKDFEKEGPKRGAESGATGAGEDGAPVPQGDYGSSGCRYDDDCPDKEQICVNNQCVTRDDPPEPPHREGDRHGSGVEGFVKDWLKDKDNRTRGPGQSPPPHKRGTKPKTTVKTRRTGKGGGTQTAVPPTEKKEAVCRWSGIIWRTGPTEWSCYCSGKKTGYKDASKYCGPYPSIDKKAKPQKVDGSKHGLDVWNGVWDKDNPGRCIVWGKDAVVLQESMCRKIGMK
jgi:hypothetical protein